MAVILSRRIELTMLLASSILWISVLQTAFAFQQRQLPPLSWRRKQNQAQPQRSTTLSSTLLRQSTTTTSSTSSSYQTINDLLNGPMSWNTVLGEADRAFRLGIQLEKSGYPRAANGSFHEAATLYQCFLDHHQDSFGHVTHLSREEDCPAVLSYTLCRLGFLSHDALSDPAAAIRLYQMATDIDPTPSAVAFQGWGVALEAAGGGSSASSTKHCEEEEAEKDASLTHLSRAVEAYRQALAKNKQNPETVFNMAICLERLGQTEESEQLLEGLQRSEANIACLVDSWGYVRWHTRNVLPHQLNLHRGTRDMLKLALDAALPLILQQRDTNNKARGLVCEFGVGSGRSLRMTQEILPLDITMHGFDTFTGLPQAWNNEPAGAYSTGGIVPNMEGEVYFHKGLFGDTLGPFLEEMGEDAFVAYANIDCDLYTSTMDILENLHGRLVKGSILVFDEYVSHSTWRQDEFRAWRESCKRFGWKYEYLGFSLATKQAVVRLTDV